MVKRRRSEAHLSKDSKVEVCSNQEGYRGAWFPAKILDPQPSDPSTKKKIKKALVQYETLASDDDPNKPHTELVHARSIRPVPPPTDNPDQPFEPADVVDASYIDVWWVGVVMRCEDDKYTVGFLNPPDLLQLKRSELRPHWDFLDGKWVRPRKKRMVGSVFSPGTAVEVNLSKEHIFGAWLPAIYLGELGNSSFLVQYKSSNNSDVKVIVRGKQIRPCIDKSPYGKTKKKQKINQKPNDDATIVGFSKKLMASEDCHLNKAEQQQVGELDNQAIISHKRKVKKGSEVEKADEEDVEDVNGLDNIESSGIMSDSERKGGSHAGTSCLLPMEVYLKLEVEQNEDGLSSEIKGKGKLPEFHVERSKDPATAVYNVSKLHNNGAGSFAADCTNDIFELPVVTRFDLTGYEDAMVEAEVEVSAMDIETIIEGSSNPAGISNKQNEVGGRQVETGVTGSEEMMRETETVDSAMDYLTKDVQVAVTGISAMASAHDQPLSLCIDEMHSIKAIECSSNPAGTAKQQNEDGGTQVGQLHLPFVRSSPLWENIESMDVFKRFPQMPHFHPLLKCKEVCREGSALGKMVNFAFLVEKTSKLQVGDPRELFDSILGALADLEMLGFDVTAVRHRLKELLEMKVKLGQLQNRSQEVDIQITACAHDRTRNNETISRIDKDIKDWQEKRVTLMSIDVAKGSEISKLESEANAITKGIQSIHRDFEKLAAAAW
ncbi:DUF724 domain-containing protein 1-like isoform X1 [Prunus avium]|uniref:DUF724 domain-containing protein 1-like isoform X1 n=1 Tax=Prunus avium TaxID=42229 RepID=A0A6P5TNT3_PRUAV|nr:DUF724 domain-containing protein 1-like isoform X1 [Prunus avium]